MQPRSAYLSYRYDQAKSRPSPSSDEHGDSGEEEEHLIINPDVEELKAMKPKVVVKAMAGNLGQCGGNGT